MESPELRDRLGAWYPFCINPNCELCVQPGDPRVRGSGNWAVLGNGLTVGRGLYGGVYLCDWCGRRSMILT
jgi:hypothetical protein